MKTIRLPVYGIEMQLDVGVNLRLQGTGVIRSELKSDCPHCSKPYCFFDCDESNAEGKRAAILAESQESDMEARKRLEKNRAYDGIESLILAAACEGIDVECPAFLAAIELAVEAVENPDKGVEAICENCGAACDYHSELCLCENCAN